MTARRPAAGFTLIELLLATGMVAMLTLSLYVGLSTAFRAKASVGAQTDALRRAKAALDLVEQNLKSILPPAGTLAGPFVGTASGTADAPMAMIDCYTLGADFIVSPDAANADGPRHVLLMLEADTKATALVRYVTRNPVDTTTASPEEEILARDVAGFGARYFDGEAWADAWDSSQQNSALPLAVELTVQIKTPTTADPNHVYKLSRIVPFACGQTPDQAAALIANSTSGGAQ